jgi:large subunit ribosomal protein L27Ae
MLLLSLCFLKLFCEFHLQGYYKVLGKGSLPKQPVIVKAKFFSKRAENKIKKVGGCCVLQA